MNKPALVLMLQTKLKGGLGKYNKYDAAITGKRTIQTYDAPVVPAPNAYQGQKLSKSAQAKVDSYHLSRGKKS